MRDRDDTFREFYEGQIPRLRRFAYRLTGNWSEADDLAQEAMVRTFRAWERIDDASRPEVYARTVLLNRHRSLLRRAIVEAKHVVRARHAEPPTDDRAVIWSELRRLPARQRAALVLHYYEDLPQTDVARILGCATGTVNSLVYRGLERLRARLSDDADAVWSET